MIKFQRLHRILERPLVAIVRASDADVAEGIAEACVAGGITALEISLTTPRGLELIERLGQRHAGRVIVGAGTVLDSETARLAILAGAEFILSPTLDLSMVRICSRYQVVSMPGVATPSEAVSAIEHGADIAKIFPGDAFGPAFIQAMRAPLPHLPFMPSGGVSLDNLGAWFESGAVAVGVGSSLSGPGLAGDLAAVESNARAFVSALPRSRPENAAPSARPG